MAPRVMAPQDGAPRAGVPGLGIHDWMHRTSANLYV